MARISLMVLVAVSCSCVPRGQYDDTKAENARLRSELAMVRSSPVRSSEAAPVPVARKEKTMPHMAFCTSFAAAACAGKKSHCSMTGFVENVCVAQLIVGCCTTGGDSKGLKCKSDKLVTVRGFDACMDQLENEWSCDYSRKMDKCTKMVD